MEDIEKEYYIQWIIADYTPFEYKNKSYFLSTPSREDRFLAERLFISTYNEALKEGLLDTKEINILLNKHNIWNPSKENTLQSLISDIDEIKLNIYKSYTQTQNLKLYKTALKDTYKYIDDLLIQKQTFDSYGAKATAMLAKQHYLLGCSIFRAKNKPIWKNWWFNKNDEIVQSCFKIIVDYILTENQYRLLARNNFWRNIWSTRKSVSNLFGRAAVDLSAYQRQLVLWSSMYDNVYKNSDCPADEIIEDDDALDGWLIKQKRERDKDTNKNTIEKSLGEKVRNSDQIYVMCDEDNIQKVYDCNDFEGKLRFKQIMKQIHNEGCVSHMGLQDTKREIFIKAGEMKGK